jgi:hypothetical protein
LSVKLGVVPEPQIFLNYRRSNAEWRADRLYDALADEFGEEQVFKDTDTIAAGTEYALVIQQALTRTDVVVALTGPRGRTSATPVGVAVSTTRPISSATSWRSRSNAAFPSSRFWSTRPPCPWRTSCPSGCAAWPPSRRSR